MVYTPYSPLYRGMTPPMPTLRGHGGRTAPTVPCTDWAATAPAGAWAARQCPHLRADTHAANLTMRHCMERAGFVYCGVIYVADGTPRVAYEKV